jgi:hypothetical protein
MRRAAVRIASFGAHIIVAGNPVDSVIGGRILEVSELGDIQRPIRVRGVALDDAILIGNISGRTERAFANADLITGGMGVAGDGSADSAEARREDRTQNGFFGEADKFKLQ